MSGLGKFLERQRLAAKVWRTAFFAVLALLAVANFFLRPQEAHFGYDALPLFWPIFGIGVGLVMVVVVKKIIQPLIVRPENYYDDI